MSRWTCSARAQPSLPLSAGVVAVQLTRRIRSERGVVRLRLRRVEHHLEPRPFRPREETCEPRLTISASIDRIDIVWRSTREYRSVSLLLLLLLLLFLLLFLVLARTQRVSGCTRQCRRGVQLVSVRETRVCVCSVTRGQMRGNTTCGFPGDNQSASRRPFAQ